MKKNIFLLFGVLFLCLFVMLCAGMVSASDTDWHVPSANSNSGWTSPQNAYAPDNQYATATSINQIVQYKTFNLPAIQSGSTINGIEVNLEAKTTGRQVTVELSYDNGVHWTSTKTSATGDTESIITLGSTSDTWGRTWSVNDFTNTNFRVKVTSQLYDPMGTIYSLDQLQVRVTYTTPDTTPPTIDEVTPVPTPTNNNTPDYTFSSTEAGAITYAGSCSSPTITAVAGLNTITLNLLSDGTYSDCTIKVTDAAENPSNILTIPEFIIDTQAPTGYGVSIDQSYINIANKDAASITISNAEIGADYVFRINDEGNNHIDRSGAISSITEQIPGFDLSSLNDGTLTLTLILTDIVGNSGDVATNIATKDTIAPTGLFDYSTTVPTNADVTATLTPSESVTVTNNYGLSQYTFIDNRDFTFEFVDTAGNTGTAIASVSNIDKINPTASITSPSTDKHLKGTETITADASDSGSGIANVIFHRSIVDPTIIGEDTTAPYSIDFDTTTVSDGEHQLYAIAYDVAGNYVHSDNISVIIDNTAPITIDNIPADWQKSAFDVVLTCTDLTSDCSKVYYTTGGNDPTTDSNFVDALSNWKFPVEEGTYTIKYMGLDNANNLETVKTALNQLKIDTEYTKLTLDDPLERETDGITFTIPAGTTITGDATWDGITIDNPTIEETLASEIIADPGYSASTDQIIQIGFSDKKLTFDQAVRIFIPGKAGKLVGYARPGKLGEPGEFHVITTCTCNPQETPDLLAEGDCKIDVGNDLVIWTKHFTQFVTYTQTAVPGNSNTGGGGSSHRDTTIIPQPVEETKTSKLGCAPGYTLSERQECLKIETEQKIEAQEPVAESNPVTGFSVANFVKENKTGTILTLVIVAFLIILFFYLKLRKKE